MSQQAAQCISNLAEDAQRKEQERGIHSYQPASVADVVKQAKLHPATAAQAKQFDDVFKSVLDYTFATLREMKPAWRNAFKSKAEAVGYKTQLGLAMQATGINTMEMVEDGLSYARKQPGAFMPSTGDFVTWCKDIADVKRVKREAVERSKRILDEKRLLSSKPWAERQSTAKSALADIRKQLGGAK